MLLGHYNPAGRLPVTFYRATKDLPDFTDYRMVRMAQAPRVETHIVPSERPPAGVGEPGVPPLAPAVANALFVLTGKRLRELPLRA